jgi:hypothetical protein
MNINTVKTTLVFVSGAVIGGIASALVVRKKLTTEIESIMLENEEIVKSLRANRYARVNKNADESMKGCSDDTADEKVVDDEGEQVYAYNDRYNKIVTDYNGSVKFDKGTKTESSKDTINNVTNLSPYIIDIEQFSEEMEDNEKVTLYYYRDDQVLTDADAEEVIADINGTVGKDSIDLLTSEIGNTVYVRNNKLRIDYEIVLLKQSYSETQMGYK